MARMAEEKPVSPLHGPRSEVLGDRTVGLRGSAASQGAGLGGLAGLLLGVSEERGVGFWVRDHRLQKDALMGQRREVRLLSLHGVDGAPASS